jgi:5-methylcytosine-specific restriction protein A
MSVKDRLYGRRWRKRAQAQIRKDPLCVMCAMEGRVTAATVADHIIPHRGDHELFWNGELQSLCEQHHNSRKQRTEKRGYDTACDVHGRPLDPNHPSNKAFE